MECCVHKIKKNRSIGVFIKVNHCKPCYFPFSLSSIQSLTKNINYFMLTEGWFNILKTKHQKNVII